MDSFKVINLGRMSYADALKIQEERFNHILECKLQRKSHNENALLIVEHNPVFTLGKSGDESNLIQNPATVGAEFFKTTRGGDITYHGPGQIVGYPIFDLEQFNMGIGQYIWNIEEAIINVIKKYDLAGDRIKEASGVWLDADTSAVRKICAIGVKASRYVTMHGFAFNVNTDMNYFTHIIPCGIEDKGVTSMEKELDSSQDFNQIVSEVCESFQELFIVEN